MTALSLERDEKINSFEIKSVMLLLLLLRNGIEKWFYDSQVYI